MFRRRFLQLITVAGAGSLTRLSAAASSRTITVTYRVRGFTCATCAVGLDTLLLREKGIAQSHSTYPEGRVTVTFDPELTSKRTIVGLISEMGFHADEDQSTAPHA